MEKKISLSSSQRWLSALLDEDGEQSRHLFAQILEEYFHSIPWSHAAFVCKSTTSGFETLASFRRRASLASSLPEIEIPGEILQEAWASKKVIACQEQKQRGSLRMRHLGIASMLAVPALGEGGVCGAIYLDSRKKPFALSKKDLSRAQEAGRLWGLWLAMRERAGASPRDEHFLEMGRHGFALIHDLRNLFTLLQSRVQWLQSEPQDRLPSLQELAEEIRLGRGRLEEILQQGVAGGASSLDLRELLEQAIARIPFLRSGEASVRIVSATEESYPIRGRRGPLLDAFTNLLLNAVDATLGEGDIELRLFRQTKEIWVRITDRGAGMGPEQLARLFEPMRRSQKEGSVGLGLFSTKKIFESHGGTISFHSSPHAGTTVSVVLPAREEVTRQKRMLLVDDEEETAETMASAIASLPVSLETVSEERQAIARAREGGFDLLVLDLGMPRRSGIEILRELRSRGVRVPALLLCARKAQVEDDLGPVVSLRKPARVEALRAAIQDALSLA